MVKATSSTGSSVTVKRDWTKGSILQNILLLSWPMIVLGVLYSVNMVLEMIWVGKLGEASIAGVGVAGIVVLLVSTIKSGLGAGERAMVARFVGEGNIQAAKKAAGQAYVITIIYGVIVILIGVLFTKQIFSLFGLAPDAAAEGSTYLRIVLIGWITEGFWLTALYIMQSSGDAITPMKIAVVIRVVNLLVCPFLILGWWIFPRLGVRGAGFAYIIATGLGMLLTFWVIFTGQSRLRLSIKDLYPDPGTLWRLLKIGIPACLMGLGKSFGDLVFTWFIVPFGTLPLAANNVISRIESFINSPATGIGMAAGALVGQNLGANQPKQAARSGWLSAALAAGFMLFCVVILLVTAENVIGLFNPDSGLASVGAFFLRIALVGYLGMTVVSVLQSSISGAGDTVPPMVITLAMLWVVQLPLAYVLSRYTSLGVYGVRWAIMIGYVVGAIAYMAYFWNGRWKRKKI